MAQTKNTEWIHAGTVEELQAAGHRLVQGGIAVFYHEGEVYAVDNRCPHLGFPLHLGSLCDGILTCHWHHARFDLCGGGTLDPWADDVPSHEVRCEEGQVWVHPRARRVRGTEEYRKRLREGLEQNIGIVIAKAIVGMLETGASKQEVVAIGLEYGISRSNGWGSGLTILTAMARVLPKLDRDGQILALYHGLLHVARGAAGRPERHLLGALPDGRVPIARLSAWYRQCVDVRDTQGAERTLLTAIDQGATSEELADMMFAAATDHRYLDGGHTLDFHNKAFEALAYLPNERKRLLLASLVPMLAQPSRAEESHTWQAPLNLVEPLNRTFNALQGITLGSRPAGGERDLFQKMLEDRPLDTIEALTESLADGEHPAELARIAALAAAERIVRFHTQNDFRDWVAVLHTFTHANAVYAALRRSPSIPLVRALYDTVVSVYLDRFLNVPAAKRPKPGEEAEQGAQPQAGEGQGDRAKAGEQGNRVQAGEGQADRVPAGELLAILDRRQQVSEAARWAMPYLRRDDCRGELIVALGHALLREDADFHTFQLFEAVISQVEAWGEREDAFAREARETLLLAATRYLAAQAPTPRETPHTARIAQRLHMGEMLFEEK